VELHHRPTHPGAYKYSEHTLELLRNPTGTEIKGRRVLRTQPFTVEWKRCFTSDEGRPLEVGVQAQASNRHKRRG
jgi:hypothetical protein